MEHSVSRIDELCELYEARAGDQFGPAAVSAFLEELVEADPRRRLLLCVELIRSDLGLAWMNWASRLNEAKEADAAVWLDQFRRLPTLADYHSTIEQLRPQEAEKAEALKVIAEAECAVRNVFGDAIGPAFFAPQLNTQLVSKRRRRGLVVVFEHEDLGEQRLPLRGYSVLGRAHQPSSELLVEGVEGNEIRFARWFEISVSREQLAIQLLSPRFAAVTNLSKNAIRVSAIGRVVANETRLLEIPFTILCGRYQRNWAHRLKVCQDNRRNARLRLVEGPENSRVRPENRPPPG